MPVILSPALIQAMLKRRQGRSAIVERSDLATRGLHARAYPAGTVIFYWMGRAGPQRKLRRFKLGDWPTTPLDAARIATLEMRQRVEARYDPVKERRTAADKGE